MPDRYAPHPEHKFSFGLWTVGNRGRDPFGDVVRDPLPPVDAVALLADDAPPLPAVLSNRGQALGAQWGHFGDPDDLERCIDDWRRACTAGLKVAPAVVVGTAEQWGHLAAIRGAWDEAVEAVDAGLAATRQLFRAQVARPHKEAWLSTAQPVPARGRSSGCGRSFLARGAAARPGGGPRMPSGLGSPSSWWPCPSRSCGPTRPWS